MTAHGPAVVQPVAASPWEVWGLLADVDAWLRWGRFRPDRRPARQPEPGLPARLRYGRHPLRVVLASPDPPYWLRVRLALGPAGHVVAGEIVLTPTDDGTEVRWQPHTVPTATRGARRQARRVAARVPGVLADLAAYVESPAGALDAWTGPLLHQV